MPRPGKQPYKEKEPETPPPAPEGRRTRSGPGGCDRLILGSPPRHHAPEKKGRPVSVGTALPMRLFYRQLPGTGKASALFSPPTPSVPMPGRGGRRGNIRQIRLNRLYAVTPSLRRRLEHPDNADGGQAHDTGDHEGSHVVPRGELFDNQGALVHGLVGDLPHDGHELRGQPGTD